jgi:hypothetical protein
MEIIKLKLITPLYYERLTSVGEPFSYCGSAGQTGEEKLFCFELDEAQSLSFEPDKEKLLRKLIFHGNAARQEAIAGGLEAIEISRETLLELPLGEYIFTQEREILNRDEILFRAIEIQLEGLWQRLKLGERLYLRYLFEDGCYVTQLFRPFY